ncbi:MAG: hypothetical protein WA813_16010 [Beijerinckiaceae bacterium]
MEFIRSQRRVPDRKCLCYKLTFRKKRLCASSNCGAELPTVLIFLGVLGGLVAFGIVGVFLGPVLLAVAYTLFQDWDVPEAGDEPLGTTLGN